MVRDQVKGKKEGDPEQRPEDERSRQPEADRRSVLGLETRGERLLVDRMGLFEVGEERLDRPLLLGRPAAVNGALDRQVAKPRDKGANEVGEAVCFGRRSARRFDRRHRRIFGFFAGALFARQSRPLVRQQLQDSLGLSGIVHNRIERQQGWTPEPGEEELAALLFLVRSGRDMRRGSKQPSLLLPMRVDKANSNYRRTKAGRSNLG
jgi:hypothetical protein